jgi:O-antigen ligase
MLLFAQVVNNVWLIAPCLLCFLITIAWAALRGWAIPVLLFFLPFAAVLKINPGAISFYTIALLIVMMTYIVRGYKRISIIHLIPAMCLIALTLIIKTAYGYSLDNTYILFVVSLMLMPFLQREIGEKYDFYWLTVFFSVGIIVAAFSARGLIIFPTITRYYIRTHQIISGGVRYAGFYGDPNFFSAHICAVLGGILVMLTNRPARHRAIALVALMSMLVYCGFMSVSKSFFVILVALFLCWIVALLFAREKMTAKVAILLTTMVGVVFLLMTTAFTDMVGMMLARLTGNQSLSELTTGRTDLWLQYLRAFDQDTLLLFFGKGLSDVLVNERASHNTIIQIIFQFGLVGGVMMAAWLICYARNLMSGVKVRMSQLTQLGILLIGAIGPWMALDLLFFDEFFLMPIYVCLGATFLTQHDEARALQM